MSEILRGRHEEGWLDRDRDARRPGRNGLGPTVLEVFGVLGEWPRCGWQWRDRAGRVAWLVDLRLWSFMCRFVAAILDLQAMFRRRSCVALRSMRGRRPAGRCFASTIRMVMACPGPCRSCVLGPKRLEDRHYGHLQHPEQRAAWWAGGRERPRVSRAHQGGR